ncbi:hypothetical protein PENSPDRAFT_480289 [Peniophora sp. CONT]|nr:hypothetical protein PENSPDRAFT_480289 [Peniophora sp. CONT]
MPKASARKRSTSRNSNKPTDASGRKRSKGYWDNEHRANILAGFHPNGERVYGAVIKLVTALDLGISSYQTFGRYESRVLPGIDETCTRYVDNAQHLFDAVKVKKGDKDSEAKKAQAQAYLDNAKRFAGKSRSNQVWMAHPEGDDPSIRFSEIGFDNEELWLTFRWWSGSAEGSYFFDIIDREHSSVLKPPASLQLIVVWGLQLAVLNTQEREFMNAMTHSWFEKGIWNYRTDNVPDTTEERYRVPLGAVVVVLRDYKVIGHIQVPMV